MRALIGRCAISNFRSTKRAAAIKKERNGEKNGTSGKFYNLVDDRYSRISMAQKTAVEKNLFDVVLSNVGGRGRDTLYFFMLKREKKNTH